MVRHDLHIQYLVAIVGLLFQNEFSQTGGNLPSQYGAPILGAKDHMILTTVHNRMTRVIFLGRLFYFHYLTLSLAKHAHSIIRRVSLSSASRAAQVRETTARPWRRALMTPGPRPYNPGLKPWVIRAFSISGAGLAILGTLEGCDVASPAMPVATAGHIGEKPSPAQALQMLREGNERFYSGKATYLHADAARLALAGSEDQGKTMLARRWRPVRTRGCRLK